MKQPPETDLIGEGQRELVDIICKICCPCSQVILHQEGHMDDALTVSRSQMEESQAARMIYSTVGLFRQFIK